jgi:hypothetical protein
MHCELTTPYIEPESNMPVSCAAYGCFKVFGRDTSDVRNWLRFYPIPNGKKKRTLWAQRIKRKEEDLNNGMRVCSDHFDDACFKNIMEVSRLVS